MLDGRAWTAGELAKHAGVARSTASEHLNLLAAGGLIRERRQGRHRYLELADGSAALLLEDLLGRTRAQQAAARTTSLQASSQARALAGGRTCYDHLAGELGVTITAGMIGRGLLSKDLALTPAGDTWLRTEVGADFSATRRPITRACLDWTERRPHLAGAAGAQLCRHALDRQWVRRIGSGRAVRITDAGRACFHESLGIEFSERC